MANSQTTQVNRRKNRAAQLSGAAAVPAAIAKSAPRRSRHTTTLALGMLGSVLLFLAFPPVDLWWLAWAAPVSWVYLIRLRDLPGRRPYRALWLAGSCFWLGVLYWLCLPYPPASWIGWLALSFYLGVYLPTFVAMSRVAVHRLRCPAVVAAPVVWAGLELAQAHVITGFSMASLGHSQYRWIDLIQISDLTGHYGVSFVVMFVAACLARMCRTGPRSGTRERSEGRYPTNAPNSCVSGDIRDCWTAWPLAPLVVVVAVVLAYGHWRVGAAELRKGAKIALIQGSVDCELKHDPARQDLIQRQYLELSHAACEADPDLDLVIWPETMYRDSHCTFSKDATPPPDWPGTVDEFEEYKASMSSNKSRIGETALWLQTPLLLGIDSMHFGRDSIEHYNSALYVDRQGRLGPRYDKTHLVLFGEYVPFAKQFPWLYQLTPLGGGLEPGVALPTFRAGEAKLAANICYESVLAHVVRDQVDRLRRQGDEPDVLVNLTNDGWFRGSNELDLHLVCGVFRAVECRKPFLIAANTGLSASIDANGRILKRGPRRETAVLVADVRLDGRASPYVRYGDLFAGACLLAALAVALMGLRDRIRTVPWKPASR
ncbi:MAG TPA: apolipoprotein N-acyltransferase [Pirellulales bacterium]|nr:apolipoprotein N-acyltransferase [Pirellulales bacterium]